jgi:hypothetical protein
LSVGQGDGERAYRMLELLELGRRDDAHSDDWRALPIGGVVRVEHDGLACNARMPFLIPAYDF